MKKADKSILLSASIDDIYVYFMSKVDQMITISVRNKRHLYPYQSSYLLHYTVVIKDPWSFILWTYGDSVTVSK